MIVPILVCCATDSTDVAAHVRQSLNDPGRRVVVIGSGNVTAAMRALDTSSRFDLDGRLRDLAIQEDLARLARRLDRFGEDLAALHRAALQEPWPMPRGTGRLRHAFDVMPAPRFCAAARTARAPVAPVVRRARRRDHVPGVARRGGRVRNFTARWCAHRRAA